VCTAARFFACPMTALSNTSSVVSAI